MVYVVYDSSGNLNLIDIIATLTNFQIWFGNPYNFSRLRISGIPVHIFIRAYFAGKLHNPVYRNN
jgi:hypothetical protein